MYTFKFSYTNDSEATVSFAHTFSNDRVTAKIDLFKVDKKTGKDVPHGDATLKGAVYGLYAREDIGSRVRRGRTRPCPPSLSPC